MDQILGQISCISIFHIAKWLFAWKIFTFFFFFTKLMGFVKNKWYSTFLTSFLNMDKNLVILSIHKCMVR